MPFLFFLILFAFCFDALLQKSLSWTPKRPHQFNFLLDSMTSFYSNLTNIYQEDTIPFSNLKEIKDSLQRWSLGDNQPNLSTTEVLVKDDRLPLEHEVEDDNEGEETSMEIQKGRSLVGRKNCQNGGFRIDVLYKNYKCDGHRVSATEYFQGNESGKDCEIEEKEQGACYCPIDSYGNYCELLREWTCDLERINYPPLCNGTDSDAYYYSYEGHPPCYPVKEGEVITMENRLSCRFTDFEYDYEGVKHLRDDLVGLPSVEQSNFTYVVNKTDLKLTALPNNTRQQINFINWKRISNPYIIETQLTPEAISGEPFKTEIKFESKLANEYALMGRYYYELGIYKNLPQKRNAGNLTYNYIAGYFEQIQYKEPTPIKEPIGLFWLLLMIIIVLIMMCCLISRVAQKQRPIVDAISRPDRRYAELPEEEEVEEVVEESAIPINESMRTDLSLRTLGSSI